MTTTRPCVRRGAGVLGAVSLALGLALSSPARADGPGAATVPVPPGEAEAKAEARWREKPTDFPAGLAYVEALCAAGKRAAAVEVFEKAAKANPGDRVAMFLRGRAIGGTSGISTMRDALAASLGPDPEWAVLGRRALAREEEASRKFADAARDAETVALATAAAADWAWVGWLFERAKDDRGARAAYEKAMAADPRSLAARNGLVLVLLRLSEVPRAVALARETVTAYPNSAEAQVHLGLVLAASGDTRGARRAYDAALARSNDDVGVLVLLGTTYLDLEQNALAHQALDRALEVAPADATVLVACATLAIDEERLEEAQALLLKASRLCPQDARVAFLQGLCAERLVNYAGAVSAYQRAMRLDPTSAEYATACALVMELKGDTDAAIAAFKVAKGLSPSDADLPLRLGFLHEKKKRWKAAEDEYRLAARLAPKSPDPHFFLAVLLGDRMKNLDGALAELETYRALGGTEPAALKWLDELRVAKSGK